MPIYEYECNSCGNRFEVIQSFSDPPIASCNSCSGKVSKVISPPAILFKGSGWYVTDYSDKLKEKGKGEVKKPSQESKAVANTGAKSGETDKQTETKPASSSDQSSPHPSLPPKGGG